MRRFSGWSGVLAAAALTMQAGAVQAYEVDAQTQAVIDRSKTTQQTYALYEWERVIRPGGPPAENWSAEFNRGPLHRVETPEVRAVANCETGAGTQLMVSLDRKDSSDEMAKVACGISTRAALLDGRWLGEVDTPFGKADRIQLTDAQLIRSYDVTKTGVIVRSEFHARGPGEPLVLASHAVAVLPDVPTGNLFDDASLEQSFVPDTYKTAPKP
jgi:hypothetical protein